MLFRSNVRSTFFGVLAFHQTLASILNYVLFTQPLEAATMIIPVTAAVFAVIAAYTPNRRFHAVYAIMNAALIATFIILDSSSLP